MWAKNQQRVDAECFGARAGGCHPRGHACGDPSRKGRVRGRLLIALRAGSGFEWGFPTRHPVSRKWPAVLAGPASRPCPFEPLACGYRPRGWHPPALSKTEVACGKSEMHGFALLQGTLAYMVCIASIAMAYAYGQVTLIASARCRFSTTAGSAGVMSSISIRRRASGARLADRLPCHHQKNRAETAHCEQATNRREQYNHVPGC